MSERHNGTVVAWTTKLAVSPEVRNQLHRQSLEALSRVRPPRDKLPPPSRVPASATPSKP